jgi:hypothetical protein
MLDENGKCLVDLVITVEHLEEGLTQFAEKLNLPKPNIPHINRTRHKNYREYYNEATKNKIRKNFELDIQLGRYEF